MQKSGGSVDGGVVKPKMNFEFYMKEVTELKKILKYSCLVIVFGMLLGMLYACKKENTTPDDSVDSVTEQPVDSGQENENNDNNQSSDQNNEGGEDTPTDKPDEDGYYVTEKYIDATLLSFNIKMAYNETQRVEAVGKSLAAQNASVICLQEVWESNVVTLQTALADSHEVIYKSLQSGRAEGLAIAYDKTQWRLVSENRFWLSETPEVKSKSWGAESYAICYNVVLEHIDSGVKLHVFNTKLDEVSETARNGGIQLVMSEIEKSPYPVFFGCDLNAVNTSEAYKIATKKLTDAQKTEGADTGVTYHKDRTTTDGLSSDFCLVSGDRITTDSFNICRDKYGENNDLFLSDHYAIKAKVKISYTVTGRPDATDDGFDGALDAVGQA